ncbi:MAG: hypothetical protein AB1589_20690 [Cyanobacteriota bacterium]
MSNKACSTVLPAKLSIDNIALKEYAPESMELQEGLRSFLLLIAIGDIFPYLILTATLLLTFPLLAPVGIIRMLFLMNRSLKKFQKLEEIYEG